MPSSYREDYGDHEGDREGDDRPPNSGERVALARRKTALPGLLLIMSGLLCVLIELSMLGLMATKPTFFYEQMVGWVKNAIPPGAEQQKQLDELKKNEDALRIDKPVNMISTLIGLVLNLLSITGGFAMRSGSGYGLALTGAITAIIPFGGCCCVTMPVGIWALIVLLNRDVKEGFAARSQSTYDDRTEEQWDRAR